MQAEDLNEARDGVRRHVEARQLLDKALLDGACEAMSHTVARMQPCSNPDFTGEGDQVQLGDLPILTRTPNPRYLVVREASSV